jgi:hypothetical protein
MPNTSDNNIGLDTISISPISAFSIERLVGRRQTPTADVMVTKIYAKAACVGLDLALDAILR